MAGANSTESPLETVAEITGEEVTQAFKILGNDTRLAILLALWDAKDPAPPVSDSAEPMVSFSALRDRVGMRDSGQFNYHLDKLTGKFIRQTEAGYSLTESAEQFLRAVFAGTLRDHASFEGEPIEAECDRCGASMVIDYSDGTLIERCTSCGGFFQLPDGPQGVNTRGYRPPAGLLHRTPQEFHRHGNTWTRHRVHSMIEGVCPDCTGAVTTTIHVCENHDADDGTLCDSCGSFWEILSVSVCDVCKFDLVTPVFAQIVTEMAVKAFFYERGIDTEARYDESNLREAMDAIKQVAVTGEEPLEITVELELASDQLVAILDEEANVIDVTVTEDVQDTG